MLIAHGDIDRQELFSALGVTFRRVEIVIPSANDSRAALSGKGVPSTGSSSETRQSRQWRATTGSSGGWRGGKPARWAWAGDAPLPKAGHRRHAAAPPRHAPTQPFSSQEHVTQTPLGRSPPSMPAATLQWWTLGMGLERGVPRGTRGGINCNATASWWRSGAGGFSRT
jgi:hypothetical protein